MLRTKYENRENRGQVFHVPRFIAERSPQPVAALRFVTTLHRSSPRPLALGVESYPHGIARPPRIEIEDGIYHVVARGNERRPIFSDNADRERFLAIAKASVGRYRAHVFAYCLMTNHYHLLVQTPEAGLARTMRQLNGVYAQDFNRRHGRDGHLFQGRYGARLVQAEAYVLAAVRYIVRNPVAAKLCERVEDWRWSSHHETIGVGPARLVSSERVLSFFGDDRETARARYLELVESDAELVVSEHPLVSGTDEFILDRIGLVSPSPEFPRAALRLPRRPLREAVTSADDETGIARAYLVDGYSMREIATHVGCGVATVHRRVRSFELRGGTWKT